MPRFLMSFDPRAARHDGYGSILIDLAKTEQLGLFGGPSQVKAHARKTKAGITQVKQHDRKRKAGKAKPKMPKGFDYPPNLATQRGITLAPGTPVWDPQFGAGTITQQTGKRYFDAKFGRRKTTIKAGEFAYEQKKERGAQDMALLAKRETEAKELLAKDFDPLHLGRARDTTRSTLQALSAAIRAVDYYASGSAGRLVSANSLNRKLDNRLTEIETAISLGNPKGWHTFLKTEKTQGDYLTHPGLAKRFRASIVAKGNARSEAISNLDHATRDLGLNGVELEHTGQRQWVWTKGKAKAVASYREDNGRWDLDLPSATKESLTEGGVASALMDWGGPGKLGWTPSQLTKHLQEHGSVTARELRFAFGGQPHEHTRVLHRMLDDGQLEAHGKHEGVLRYSLPGGQKPKAKASRGPKRKGNLADALDNEAMDKAGYTWDQLDAHLQEHGAVSVSDMVTGFGKSSAIQRAALKRLTDRGFLQANKQGRTLRYSLAGADSRRTDGLRETPTGTRVDDGDVVRTAGDRQRMEAEGFANRMVGDFRRGRTDKGTARAAIKTYQDMGGDPETVKHLMSGLKKGSSLRFTVNPECFPVVNPTLDLAKGSTRASMALAMSSTDFDTTFPVDGVSVRFRSKPGQIPWVTVDALTPLPYHVLVGSLRKAQAIAPDIIKALRAGRPWERGMFRAEGKLPESELETSWE